VVKIVLVIIGIIVVLIASSVIIGSALFDKKVKNEIKSLFNKTKETKPEVVADADIEGLPGPVQKWLKNSQAMGKEEIFAVRLKQKGLIRTKEGQPWMPAEAEQYFTIDEPGFIWKVRVRMAPLLYLAGRDRYYGGRGSMRIKLLGLIPVVNAEGKEIDQGTMLRYLGETVWFPTAALSSYIKWEDIDSNSAKATMSYGGVTASAVFEFNEDGEVTSFRCKRYMTVNDSYILEDYSVHLKDYKELNGIRIPTKGEAIWNLKTGDFSVYQFEITEIEYNKPLVY
jgi:hypothetical protein